MEEIIEQLGQRFHEQINDECGEIAHEIACKEVTPEDTEEQILERFNEIQTNLYKEVIKML